MESFSSSQCMVAYSGVHSSLHPRFHHQIVFAKFDLTLYYLLPYKRRVWDYEYASTAQIKNALAFSTGNKHLVIALPKRRFLFLMKQVSML